MVIIGIIVRLSNPHAERNRNLFSDKSFDCVDNLVLPLGQRKWPKPLIRLSFMLFSDSILFYSHPAPTTENQSIGCLPLVYRANSLCVFLIQKAEYPDGTITICLPPQNNSKHRPQTQTGLEHKSRHFCS